MNNIIKKFASFSRRLDREGYVYDYRESFINNKPIINKNPSNLEELISNKNKVKNYYNLAKVKRNPLDTTDQGRIFTTGLFIGDSKQKIRDYKGLSEELDGLLRPYNFNDNLQERLLKYKSKKERLNPVSNNPVSNNPVSNNPVSNNPVSNNPVSNTRINKKNLIISGIIGGLGIVGAGLYLNNKRKYNKKNYNYWNNKK